MQLESSLTQLLIQKLIRAYNKDDNDALHYFPLVTILHWSPADSIHKGVRKGGPVMTSS